MPGKIMKIGSFSDWEGLFKEWREEIGVNHDDIRNFKFDTLYGAIETNEITFGYYKGRNKWENVRQIPTQNMRDALMNLIVYQGDTEFASVEQQRYLFETAPSDYDRSSLTRVMIEEMRHGWQMCALLIDHFGTPAKWKRRRCWSAKPTRTSACWDRLTKSAITGWTFLPSRTLWTATANSSCRC